MSAFHDNALMGASGQQGYKISRSVRLRSSASSYLNRTLGTPTSGTTWTWSGWVKRGSLASATQGLQHAYSATNNQGGIFFSSDSLVVIDYPTSTNCNLTTTQVFRDPSAWYHLVVSTDTTQATASNRLKVYVNGVQITAFSTATYPTQNTTFRMVASGNSGSVGRYYDGTSYYFDGYLTDINFIDGQALTPSSFGETDTLTGVWKPKKYAGTYGNNGYYLNFSDNSGATATTIGKDNSGNGNNWTPNNISVTAGVTYDSMLDVPTVGAASSNYATLNPLVKQDTGYTTTISAANLEASITYSSGSNMVTIPATMNTGSSGKWYFEVTATSTQPSGGSTGIGVSTVESTTVSTNLPRNSYIYVGSDGSKTSYTGTAVNAAYGASYTTNDVIGVALDIDAGTLTFYKNNTSQGTAFTGLAAGNYFPIVSSNGTGTRSYALNCGQRPFSYTPPTGFLALNTQNLPAPTISNGAQYMAATTYTGNGTARSIVNTVNGVSMQPDFVWIKDRSVVRNHRLVDSVRGVGLELYSDLTNAQATDAIGLTAFNSNGFSLGTSAGYNQSGNSLIAWQWQAGAGSSSSNTSGTITSTVSAGATQGFSVVTYTGTGANATVGHGLGVAPKMVITKNRAAAANWLVYHASLGATQYLGLNQTIAAQTNIVAWNNTAPSSTVFSIGTDSSVNGSGNTMVAYCFSEVAGYSKFGSYTGNGSADGPFVYCGFRPRLVLVKRTDVAGYDWELMDTARDAYNAAANYLYPNSSAAEFNGPSNTRDFLSNGFKIRHAGAGANASGGTYIFAAFAENPFKNSLAR